MPTKPVSESLTARWGYELQDPASRAWLPRRVRFPTQVEAERHAFNAALFATAECDALVRFRLVDHARADRAVIRMCGEA